MKHLSPQSWTVLCLVAFLGMSAPRILAEATEDTGSPWRVGVSAGWLDLEGNDPLSDSFLSSLRLGYATSERWTTEGVLDVAPEMDENTRVEWSSGARISRLQEESKPGTRNTASTRFSIDELYSLAPSHRIEPYVGAGVGVIWYEEDFGSQWEPAVRIRAGCQYHLDSSWAVQADVCAMVAGWDVEANSIGSLGIVWKFGQPNVPRSTSASPQPPAAALGHALTDIAQRAVVGAPTNLTQGAEDLQSFELQMNFDADAWTIRQEYFSDLDAIGKILSDDPGAKARIEGHVDRKAKSDARSEKRLTQKRADAIADYLEKNARISGRRLSAVGYGFDRPKAANDPVTGNPQNCRMEIHLTPLKPAPKAQALP
jgi:outer membrane protein OmpA-like peptidoglycan-associated protein